MGRPVSRLLRASSQRQRWSELHEPLLSQSPPLTSTFPARTEEVTQGPQGRAGGTTGPRTQRSRSCRSKAALWMG